MSVLFVELTGGSKETVVYVSVGVVFIQFVGIVLFHTLQRLKKIWKCFLLNDNETRAQEEESGRYKLIENESQESKATLVLGNINVQPFLEDYAENVDAK